MMVLTIDGSKLSCYVIQNLYQNIKITVHEFDEVKSPSSIKHILAAPLRICNVCFASFKV